MVELKTVSKSTDGKGYQGKIYNDIKQASLKMYFRCTHTLPPVYYSNESLPEETIKQKVKRISKENKRRQKLVRKYLKNFKSDKR